VKAAKRCDQGRKSPNAVDFFEAVDASLSQVQAAAHGEALAWQWYPERVNVFPTSPITT